MFLSPVGVQTASNEAEITRFKNLRQKSDLLPLLDAILAYSGRRREFTQPIYQGFVEP